MNIALVISSLNSGGAERVLVGMANWWVSRGVHVTIITYSTGNDFYDLLPGVNRVRLDLLHNSTGPLDAIRMFIWRVLCLRRAIKASKPDCVVSFIDKTNVLTLLACLGSSLRVVVSERTNPEHYHIRKAWGVLRDIVYRRADTVVVQTESLRSWAEMRVSPSRVAVIPNALDKERIMLMDSASVISPTSGMRSIVAVGRMSHEKGHDLLIKACAKILPQYPGWCLDLVGDGPLRGQLEQMAQINGISSQVHFHGQLKNPFGVVKGADLFVLPSRVEGFPNVLLEAMALGVPAVSFDCASGPSELITSQVSGLLVPPGDVEGLASAMRALLDDPERRATISAEAYRVRERYSESEIMGEWNRVTGL